MSLPYCSGDRGILETGKRDNKVSANSSNSYQNYKNALLEAEVSKKVGVYLTFIFFYSIYIYIYSYIHVYV